MVRILKPSSDVAYFALAGVIGYLVDLTITIIFTPLFGKYIARIPGFLLASTATWVFNRNVTFRHHKSQKKLIAEWLRYESLMLVGLAINFIVYSIVVSILPENILSTSVAVAIGAVVGMIANFINSKRYLFKH